MIDSVETSAEMAKFNFLLENVFALLIIANGGGSESVDALAAQAASQFKLRGSRWGMASVSRWDAIHDLAGKRLAAFFDGLKARLQSAEAGGVSDRDA